MTLPDHLWVADLSTRFPDVTFRLLTGVPMDERSLELGEITGPDAATVADALFAHPDVVEHRLLYANETRALAKYETTEQGLFEFLGGTDIPPEFPLTVADGVVTFSVTATHSQFDRLGETLDAGDYRYELLSVVQGDARSDVLTTRQRECLTVAVREGYFTVPRECTLSDVAATLDVDESTASETLRRATERIVDWFLLDVE